ncbi:site-specific DNA-methyltransferase [Ureibacillus chungkukjangi]|uniref:DNA methyltransferase n=1 Tax=Ureibacillus chungkukjangi TaxID=1202712 RepID=UPI002041236B|nr:site-specific DNA-methyltransferase [Ureibacillus chungkukjangi]MCM3390377.1 site-specific DNA-methyltransferase [Ureibacillus chungkukjangi]
MSFNPPLCNRNGSLISGDNLIVMNQLAQQGYIGKFDMIYFDGPFNSGLIFSNYNEQLKFDYINPWSELASLQNYFDKDGYLAEYKKRISLAKDLLSDNGVFVLQINLLEGHYVRVLLDEVFGRENFLTEVIWKNSDIPMAKPGTNSQYGCQHETIYFYSKSKNYLKKPEYVYGSVWDEISGYGQLGDENTNFPSQKPEKLIDRIIEMTTTEGALIGDFYCGSGTFPFVAERMNRNWIACETTQSAIEITRTRLSNEAIDFTYHKLVDEFNPSYLQEFIYRKETKVPFSVNEYLGLRKKVAESDIVKIYAYSYDEELDFIVDREKFILYYLVPLITEEGISEYSITEIPRPTLVKANNRYELEVRDPSEWVLYNIVHVERNELGCIKEKQTENGVTYVYNWEAILKSVNTILNKIDGNWIREVKTYKVHTTVVDVFGNHYTIKE